MKKVGLSNSECHRIRFIARQTRNEKRTDTQKVERVMRVKRVNVHRIEIVSINSFLMTASISDKRSTFMNTKPKLNIHI